MLLFRGLLLVVFIQATSAQTTCSTQLRLVGGGDQYAGRVEVLFGGSEVWQTVCDDSWDIFEANVVCQQLGYGSATRAVTDSVFGEGGSEQWKRSWLCSGAESCLEGCISFLVSDSSRCSTGQNAGVICSLSSVTSVSVQASASSSSSSVATVAGVTVGVIGVLLCICCPLGIIIIVVVVCLCCATKQRRPRGTSTNASSLPPKTGSQIPMNNAGYPAYNPDITTASGYTSHPTPVTFFPSPYPAPSVGGPALQPLQTSQQPTNSEMQPPMLPYPAADTHDLPPAYNSVLASTTPYPSDHGLPPTTQYHYYASADPNTPSAPAGPV